MRMGGLYPGLVGIGRKGRRGPAWHVDPKSGWNLPASTADFNAFLAAKGLSDWSPPNLAYDCQDPSGNLKPSIGSIELPPVGSPTYSQAMTGMATLGVRFSGQPSQAFTSNDASLPDPSAVSVLLIALLDADTLHTNSINFPHLLAVSSDMFAGLAGGPDWRFRCGANNATSTNAVEGRGVVPFVIQHDISNLGSAGYTDIDQLLPVYDVVSSAKLLSLGNDTVYTAGLGFGVVRLWYWWGTPAERSSADIRAFIGAVTNTTPTW